MIERPNKPSGVKAKLQGSSRYRSLIRPEEHDAHACIIPDLYMVGQSLWERFVSMDWVAISLVCSDLSGTWCILSGEAEEDCTHHFHGPSFFSPAPRVSSWIRRWKSRL
jgi:hypothetical protein